VVNISHDADEAHEDSDVDDSAAKPIDALESIGKASAEASHATFGAKTIR